MITCRERCGDGFRVAGRFTVQPPRGPASFKRRASSPRPWSLSCRETQWDEAGHHGSGRTTERRTGLLHRIPLSAAQRVITGVIAGDYPTS